MLAACGFLTVNPVGLDVSFVAETLWTGVGAGHKTKHTKDGNHGGRTVTDQGQGQADNGHDTDTHTNIDQDLEHQCGSCTEANQSAHIVRAFCTHVNTAGNDGQFQHHDQNTAEKAHLFANGGEDVVCVLGKQVAALGTVTIEQTLSGQTAAGEGLQIHHVVVALVDALRVDGFIE